MPSEKFLKFLEIWQKEFGIERTIDEQICVDIQNQPLPWYTYPAIEYLNQFDYGDKRIFEFGCGMSSLFWAQRAQEVISVENDSKWFDKWQKELCAKNLRILLKTDSAYEKAVLESQKKFDVIVIDGIRRAECAETALRALNSGGMIILDDSDRTKTSQPYRQAVAKMKESGLLEVDFYGFCPMNIYPKVTSVFFSRDFQFKTKSEIQPVCGIGSLWKNGRRARKALYSIQCK